MRDVGVRGALKGVRDADVRGALKGVREALNSELTRGGYNYAADEDNVFRLAIPVYRLEGRLFSLGDARSALAGDEGKLLLLLQISAAVATPNTTC